MLNVGGNTYHGYSLNTDFKHFCVKISFLQFMCLIRRAGHCYSSQEILNIIFRSNLLKLKNRDKEDKKVRKE